MYLIERKSKSKWKLQNRYVRNPNPVRARSFAYDGHANLFIIKRDLIQTFAEGRRRSRCRGGVDSRRHGERETPPPWKIQKRGNEFCNDVEVARELEGFGV